MPAPVIRLLHRGRWLLAAVAILLLAMLAVALSVMGADDSSATAGKVAVPTPERPVGPAPALSVGAPLNAEAAGQLCFGAASRDPLAPCANPALRLAAIPSPHQAAAEPNAFCRPVRLTATLLPCSFGVPRATASGHFALIGDSHAGQWRAALAGVAEARNWHGTSITRSSCLFSATVTRLRPPADRHCVQWNRDTLRWLRAHPEVTTVFVSQHSGGDVLAAPGFTAVQTQVAGYVQRWRTLPATVRQLFVIRDTPRSTSRSNACVARALRRRRPPGTACAVPRRFAVRPDPGVTAARRIASRRVRLVNLTRYMCSAARCPPVVGGALVRRDVDHMTQTFAASLAPYLLRRVDAVVSR